jgi:hypothetical protein
MGEPEDIPNYATCACQHCKGRIKFDANQLRAGESRSVECPHCHLETNIFLPARNDEGVVPVKKVKSSKIELFLFELTRLPTVVVALIVLVALIVVADLSIESMGPEKPLKPPVISYAMVAPSQEMSQKNERVNVSGGPKIAEKNAFPQPVVDFLLKHIGFSLKPWLDQVKPEHRQPFLDNLASILQTANTKHLTDDQLKQVVGDFADTWIAAVKYDADLQEKMSQERGRRFMTLITIGFGLLITLLILSLVLVLLAIERNTRPSASQKPPNV